ncbi:MAG: hypothetical protein JF606_11645 [Burkholderiales bacterium]|nr:hypothetical protein [Burkholderiales bacterium]
MAHPDDSSTKRLRPALATSALAFACAIMTAGCASDADAGVVAVSVVDRDTGQTLPVYYKDRQQYVAGQPGHRYSVRVINQTAGRVLAVMSVDGVNVVTGQTASSSQAGYVYQPWQSYEISGWRKSESEVAAFEFSALSQSYAARTGRPADVGVIGVAVFAERAPIPADRMPMDNEQERRNDGRFSAPLQQPTPAPAAAESSLSDASSGQSANQPAAKAARDAFATRRERLGTAHGAREYSYSSHTTFERSNTSPMQIISIRYDSVDNLVAMGVIPRHRSTTPDPFPRDHHAGFVPDPPRDQ